LSADLTAITARFGLAKAKRPWQLVAAFANWSTDDREIVRFVRRFGPLIIPHGKRGATFSVRLDEWRANQRAFRRNWKRWSNSEEWGRWHPVTIFKPDEETIEHAGEGVTLGFRTLGRYLTFVLHVLPRERLKSCDRPDCPHPYFIAQHRNERYCSEECANWGDRQVKLRWWKRTGAGQRRARSRPPVRRGGK